MNKLISDAFDEFKRTLYDTSIPRSEYIDAIEEIVETLESDLGAAKAEQEREGG